MQNALEIITKEKKKQFPIFQQQRLRSCQKWWAFLTLCALPVELQRGRRPISIKNHDMAQETPRFSEDGPWTRDQFARQGTLISFFPRLWTRDSCTFMIIYTSVFKKKVYYFYFFAFAICTWCILHVHILLVRDVNCFFFFKFSSSDVIFVKK